MVDLRELMRQVLHGDEALRAYRDALGISDHVGQCGGWVYTRRFPFYPSRTPVTSARHRPLRSEILAACHRTVGIKPAPGKSNPIHFEWLALHHVGRWNLPRIVERYRCESGSPDIAVVSRAITQTAALAGLTLRSARGRKLSRAAHS